MMQKKKKITHRCKELLEYNKGNYKPCSVQYDTFFKYFKEESLQKYADQYGWTIIDDSNRKDMFMDMVRQMDMSYSYKPVLLKAILTKSLRGIVAYIAKGHRRARKGHIDPYQHATTVTLVIYVGVVRACKRAQGIRA